MLVSLRRRFCSAIFLLWFGVLVAVPGAVHRCPVHDAPMGPMPMGSMAGMPTGTGHADQTSSHSSHHGAHHCSCLGDCCASAPADLPRAFAALGQSALHAADAAPLLDRRATLVVANGVRQPYPNGPPPQA